MEPEGSLPHSKVPATCPYPQPDRFQSIHAHPTSCRSILVLSSNLCLVSQVVSFPQVSPPRPCICLSSPIHATCPAHLIRLDFITQTILGEYISLSSSLCSFLHSLVTSSLLAKIFSTPYSQTPSTYVPPSV